MQPENNGRESRSIGLKCQHVIFLTMTIDDYTDLILKDYLKPEKSEILITRDQRFLVFTWDNKFALMNYHYKIERTENGKILTPSTLEPLFVLFDNCTALFFTGRKWKFLEEKSIVIVDDDEHTLRVSFSGRMLYTYLSSKGKKVTPIVEKSITVYTGRDMESFFNIPVVVDTPEPV